MCSTYVIKAISTRSVTAAEKGQYPCIHRLTNGDRSTLGMVPPLLPAKGKQLPQCRDASDTSSSFPFFVQCWRWNSGFRHVKQVLTTELTPNCLLSLLLSPFYLRRGQTRLLPQKNSGRGRDTNWLLIKRPASHIRPWAGLRGEHVSLTQP